ncbi:M42 family metallopeptidase [bacterium]|nr:M42 family metallopeptidase [bacterium]
MRKESLVFLEEITNMPMPSGFERSAQEVWMKYAKQYADETKYDAYGNAIAILNPKGKPRLMLVGHGDAVGLIVTFINDQGYVHFMQVGGIDPMTLIAQRVVIHNKKGNIFGVIGKKAIHMTPPEDRKKVPKHEELWIDIGAKDKKNAEKMVSVGDYISINGTFEMLKNNLAVGCRMDNKIGIWAVAEVLRMLKGSKIDACVIAVSSVQEEIGGTGAKTAAYHLEPDVAIAIDVTQATDHPGCVKEKYGDVKCGDGPVVDFGPAIHPVVLDGILSVAKKNKIKLQHTASGGRTGTDADSINISRGGVPTALIGLANRYMHTTVEVVHLGDLEKIAKLLTEYAKSLKKNIKFF